MDNRVRKLLIDLSIACREIMEFSDGLTFEQYLENRLLQLAIEREFEIIGEALSRLSRIDEATLEERIPEFRKIIGFRNLLAHGYDTIDDASLWDFAKNKVPELLKQIERY